MTATVTAVTPGLTAAPVAAASLRSDLLKILADGSLDAETAVANVKVAVTSIEASAPISAVTSFVGTALKSGRGGACLALVGAGAVAAFLGPMAPFYMLAVVAVLVATSSGAVAMLTGTTKGEPGWAIFLAAIVVAFAGGALLWAIQNGAFAVLAKVF